MTILLTSIEDVVHTLYVIGGPDAFWVMRTRRSAQDRDVWEAEFFPLERYERLIKGEELLPHVRLLDADAPVGWTLYLCRRLGIINEQNIYAAGQGYFFRLPQLEFTNPKPWYCGDYVLISREQPDWRAEVKLYTLEDWLRENGPIWRGLKRGRQRLSYWIEDTARSQVGVNCHVTISKQIHATWSTLYTYFTIAPDFNGAT